MKNKIKILICLLCCFSFMQGQEYQYIPLVEDDVCWSYCDLRRVGPGAADYEASYFQYQFEGDSIINGVDYKKLYRNECSTNTERYVAAMREVDKKVFALFPNNDNEVLLYDFNLEEGGKVYSHYTKQDYTVTAIDSIEVAGKKRKRYNIDNSYDTWIEGIGTISGREVQQPLAGISLYDDGTHLNYQRKGMEIVFKTDEWYFNSEECSPTASLKTDKDGFLAITFNSANSQIQIIDLRSEKSYLFELFDLTGQRLIVERMDKDNNYIDTNNLSFGSYIYRLTDNVKTISSKIIIFK